MRGIEYAEVCPECGAIINVADHEHVRRSNQRRMRRATPILATLGLLLTSCAFAGVILNGGSAISAATVGVISALYFVCGVRAWYTCLVFLAVVVGLILWIFLPAAVWRAMSYVDALIGASFVAAPCVVPFGCGWFARAIVLRKRACGIAVR